MKIQCKGSVQTLLYNLINPLVPIDRFLPLIFGFIFNNVIYFVTSRITYPKLYDLSIPLDERVPFVPAFILVYFGCYLFWAVNYILIARQGREHAFRFFVADVMSRLVCLLFFLVLPSTVARPEVAGDGICSGLVRLLYDIDPSINLFPSIHCLVSWFCFIGIRSRKNIPLWYRAFSCIVAVGVFISTVTLRQHVIVDIISGVLLAEIMYAVSWHVDFYLKYQRFFDKITNWIWKIDKEAKTNE